MACTVNALLSIYEEYNDIAYKLYPQKCAKLMFTQYTRRNYAKTRMHSSRMRTAGTLTVFHGSLPPTEGGMGLHSWRAEPPVNRQMPVKT